MQRQLIYHKDICKMDMIKYKNNENIVYTNNVNN